MKEENKETFLLRIWRDPVWSKVIASVVILLLSALGTFILSLFTEKTFFELLADLLNYKLTIWIVLSGLLLLWIAVGVYCRFRRKPKPKFLAGTEQIVKNVRWTWVWEYNSVYDRYGIASLSPDCPKCKSPMVLEIDGIYHCKCGKEVLYEKFNGSTARNLILADLKRRYSKEVDRMMGD